MSRSQSCLLGTCSDITLDLNVTESVMLVRNVQRYHFVNNLNVMVSHLYVRDFKNSVCQMQAAMTRAGVMHNART